MCWETGWVPSKYFWKTSWKENEHFAWNLAVQGDHLLWLTGMGLELGCKLQDQSVLVQWAEFVWLGNAAQPIPGLSSSLPTLETEITAESA